MYITLTFNRVFRVRPVRKWMEENFTAVGFIKPILMGAGQIWKVSDEHIEQTVEDDILETWPLDWPMTGIWISDKEGNEIEGGRR